ncbi:hypothetical protein BOX15_Mlig003039g2 [Macrostomum lignano]|uniref:Cyclin N-terminal domain-containing protein n=1 Tax=Macrostomum lignano TaxID=282301 RepID=A0A267EH50_9PLAT|nr:hypothetical protein BOX15_Mlig003039g2 [Macrostomum lignano]
MKGLKVADINKAAGLRLHRRGGEAPAKAGQQQPAALSKPGAAAAASKNKNKENAASAKPGNNNKAVRLPAVKAKPAVVDVPPAAAAVPATGNAADRCTESLKKKYSEVGDVDNESEDSRDCLLVSAYVKDIFTYLQQLEISAAAVRPDFLQSPSRLQITPRMRTILCDWLVQVHQRYTLLPESLYLTYHIIDAFMSSDAGASVKKSEFQLIGVSAMLLASKYEEIYPPNVADFVYITDQAFTAAEIRATEQRLLKQLNFFLGYPLPIHFLRRYSKVAAATPAVHEAAKYLAELARADYSAAHLPPSGLAAGAFCLARELLPSREGACGGSGWTDALEVFSGYSRQQLEPLVRQIAGLAVRAGDNAKYTAIRKKYSSSSGSMVSTWPELDGTGEALRSAAGLS